MKRWSLARHVTVGMAFCLLAVSALAQGESPQAAQGLVRPARQVQLGAAIAGQLQRIEVKEGQRVEEGQLLAGLKDDVQRQAVAATQLQARSTAEVRQAELQKAEAEVQLERLQNALAKKAASEWEVRRATLQVKLATVALEAARERHALYQAHLKLEQARLDQHRIAAPFAGQVVRIDAEIGQALTPEAPVLTLVDLTTLEAVVHMPVAWYGRLKTEKTYTLRAEAPIGKDLKARLKFIDPMIDPAARSFRCVFEIDNADLSLPAGFTVWLNQP